MTVVVLFVLIGLGTVGTLIYLQMKRLVDALEQRFGPQQTAIPVQPSFQASQALGPMPPQTFWQAPQ